MFKISLAVSKVTTRKITKKEKEKGESKGTLQEKKKSNTKEGRNGRNEEQKNI